MWIDLTDYVVYDYLYQLKQARPSVSFPEPMTETVITEHGFAPIKPATPPTYDPITEDLVNLPPKEVDNVWIQQWEVIPATPEEIAQRILQRRMNMIVSPLQAKVELLERTLLDEVEAVIAAETDPVITLAWNSATEFVRLSPLVALIAEAMGWDDVYLDALFTEAAKRTF